MKSITLTVDVPENLEDRIKSAGKVMWGAVGPKSDAEHIEDFKSTLALTREFFDDLQGELTLQGVYLDNTEIVVAHTGISPNSANHARVMVGLWNALHDEIMKS